MNDQAVIRTTGLVKDYGDVRALHGVDLEVHAGEIFGFLGPNGAGKSTTIRVLLDILRPNGGSAEVFGLASHLHGPEIRRRVGYLPGALTLASRQTSGDLLRQLAALRGGAGVDGIAPLAERFGLDLDRPARDLSKGNRQKIGIVQAFMHQPDLLVLDEPTSGLDPLLQREFLDLVREAQERGATVFMSSHVLSEVEAVVGRVAIIRDGVIVDLDHVGRLRHAAGQLVELRFAAPVAPDDFEALEGVDDLHVDGTTLTCLLRGEPDALLKLAARHHVVGWSSVDRDLEDLFLDYYRTAPATGGAS